ncbi:MAG: hypothetical protein MUO26_07465 [Methanotrichaceae archaeon]|nr:hypothetical protein [Methanotrichaceae archaeon]
MPENQEDQEKFEQEYRNWIQLMAIDVARRVAVMSQTKRRSILKDYCDFRDPRLVFRKVSGADRIMRLAGESISKYILIETKAIPFFHSIYSALPGVLDFAVAMNRFFYFRRRWFPIIALNSEYIRQSEDRILSFTLNHELEMSRIFREIFSNLKSLSSEEKRDIASAAQKISADKLKITQKDLFEDEKLMDKLSFSQPLIPKPYAERSMLIYLEDNIAELEQYGISSRNPEEETFGEELYNKFQRWSGFSQNAYNLFVREILAYLGDCNKGYG